MRDRRRDEGGLQSQGQFSRPSGRRLKDGHGGAGERAQVFTPMVVSKRPLQAKESRKLHRARPQRDPHVLSLYVGAKGNFLEEKPSALAGWGLRLGRFYFSTPET